CEPRQSLEVVCDQLRVVEAALEPRLPGADDDTVFLSERKAAVVDRERSARAHFRQLPLTPRDLGALYTHRLRRDRLVENVDAPEQIAELEAPEHLPELRAVGREEHELGRVAVELEISAHRRELLRLPRLVRVLGDVLSAR